MLDTRLTPLRYAWVLAALLGTPQARAADSEIWTDAAVDFRVADDWTVGTETSVRTPLATAPVQFNQDLLGEFRATKWLRLGAAYRFRVREWSPTHVRHRLGLDQSFRLLKDPVKLSLRLRETLRVPTAMDDARLTLRQRLKVALPLEGRLEPFASTELFLRPLEGPGVANKLRSSAGVDVDIEVAELTLQYRVETPLADGNDPWVHIAGVGVKFDVDLRGED